MNAEITTDTTENGVPYKEIRFSPYEEDWYIFFRRYPKNVFVAIEDERCNPGGVDLLELFLTPTEIIQKTPIIEFDPYKAFLLAYNMLGLLEQDFDKEVANSDYAEVESKIKEWQA